MNRSALMVIGIVITTLASGSCARPITLSSPAQLGKLPVSRGLNGGSYVNETPWKYRGTNLGNHYFDYYYNTDNLLRHIGVAIPARSTALDFRETPLNAEPRWVTLQTTEHVFRFHRFRHYER